MNGERGGFRPLRKARGIPLPSKAVAEVARTASLLGLAPHGRPASPAASFISGANLVIDGAFTRRVN